MRDNLQRWVQEYKANPLVIAIVAAVLGALLTRFIPFLWSSLKVLSSWIGKRIGGKFAYRQFEKQYLDWLVINVRELKLTGVVTFDEVKKPQLEQVFVSVRVGEHRETVSGMELAGLLLEYLYTKHRQIRTDVEREVLLDLIRGRLSGLHVEHLQFIEEFVLRELDLRHSAALWMRHLYQRLRPRKKEDLLREALAELSAIADRSMDRDSISHRNGTGQLKRLLRKHQRIAILGAPGAGKTTLLQYVALTYARERAGDRKLCQHGIVKQRLGTTNWRLPIFIPLGSIAGFLMESKPDGTDPSIADVLYQILPPDLQGEPVATKYFLHQLERGNCIVLLDGLDEVATDTEFHAVVRAIESMAVRYGHNLFLLTSREAGWRGGVGADFSIFYVNDLTDSQVEVFIDSWYAAVELNAVVGRLEDEGHAERRERERRAARRASELKTALRENIGIRRLASNPMLLSIIALVHRSLATLPKERSKLYSECAKILLEQWDISRGVRVDDTSLKLEQKEVLMRRLAVAFHRGEIGEKGGGREATRAEVQEILLNMLPSLGRPTSEAPRLLQHLIERSGIITERRRDVLAFAHLTFQEYFAAQFLASADLQENCEFLLDQAHLLSDWWREVILLFAGLLTDSSELVRRIYDPTADDVFRQRLRLAGLCLAEAVAIKDPTVRQTIATDLVKVRTGGVVSRTSEAISPEILSYLVTWSKGHLWYALAAKAAIATTRDIKIVTQSLLAALDDRRPEVCIAALRSMPLLPPGLISEDVTGKGLAFLQSRDESVRLAAAQTFVELGRRGLSEGSVLRLTTALREEDSIAVGEAIVKALAAQGDRLAQNPQAQASLNAMFSDQRKEVRRLAPEAFELIASQPTPAQVDAFFSLIIDSDPHTRWQSRRVLSKILERDSVDALVRHLLDLCSREDTIQRSFAVEALGWLNPRVAAEYKVVDKLFSLLSEEKPRVRMEAAGSLIRLVRRGSSEDVVKAALKFLDDPNCDIPVVAIKIIQELGRIAMPDHVIRRLLDLLSLGSDEVKSSAALALAQASESSLSGMVISRLIAASRSRKTSVRSSSIRALGSLGAKIPKEEVIDTVVSALKDRKVAVRAAAAAAIVQLGQNAARKESVDALLLALTGKSYWERTVRPMQDIWVFRSREALALHSFRYAEWESMSASDLQGAIEFQEYRRHFFPNFRLARGGTGAEASILLRVEAASALAVLGSAIATKPILDGFRRLLDSGTTPTGIFIQAKALEAMADLGSRTFSESVFDDILRILRQQPVLAQLMSRAFQSDAEGEAPYYAPAFYFQGTSRQNAPDHPLLVVGRKVPAGVVADRLEKLLKEPSVSLRLIALGVFGALENPPMPRNLVETISKNLLDEEPQIRERAWALLEKQNKEAGAWS